MSLAISGGSNSTTTFAYDKDGRMNSLTNPFGETTQWSYLDNGWLYSQQLQNNIITSYSYNGRGWLTGQVSQLPSTMMVASFGGTSGPGGTAMGYDAVGNRLQETASISSRYSGTSTYQYDKGGSAMPANNRSQLTGEAFASADQNFSSYTNYHTYDANNALGPGNPTAFSAATSSPTYVNRTYNADNQLTGDAASNTYAYDGNGNPTTYKGNTLAFDPENRLTSYGTALSNGYTAEGLRAWKRSGTGTPNFYLYDGDDPICELDGSDGSFKRVNTWGANGLISRITKASSTGYYTYDPQGNLCQLLNGGAGVSVSYHTDAFGNVTSSNGSGATFAFGAQWGYSADSETGFVLCGHRFYDPTNGRWITRDPLGYLGSINLYQFCENDPADFSDPTGCSAIWQSGGVQPLFPNHQFLTLGKGCPGLINDTGRPAKSVGFWPGPGRTLPGIIGSGSSELHIDDDHDDPSDPSNTRVKRNSDPNFEHALCQCIYKELGAGIPPYGFAPYNCVTWSNDMWDCAKKAVNKCPTPIGPPPWGSSHAPPIIGE